MKINAKTPVANTTPVQNAPAPAASPAQPTMAGDSLQVTRQPVSPGYDALKTLSDARELPPMPRGKAEQRAWLMDGFTRLMKMSAAEESLRKAWRDGKVDSGTVSVARPAIWAVQQTLAKAPAHAEVKKEFFGGVIQQANALIDTTATYPAPPADKAGKEAWLVEAKAHLVKLEEANRIMKDCWIQHQELPFDAMTAASRKVFAFDGQIRRVDRELNPLPPAPPRQPGTSSPGGPGRPLFELTQGAQKGLDSKNPVGQTVGAIVMPIAITLDVIDMLTRPLQWMESAKKVEVKKSTVIVNGGQVRIK